MRLSSPHKDWRLPEVTVLDVRAVGLDQLVTQLWLRVKHENRDVARRALRYSRVAEIAALIEDRRSDSFRGFDEFPGAAEAWLRSDLLKVFKRSPEEYAVARPLHLLATRLRNTKRDGDSNASSVIYGWLAHTAPDVLRTLRDFIEVDPENETSVDLPTLALALLGGQEDAEVPIDSQTDLGPRPLCFAQAEAFSDDLRRLLAYRFSLPRPVVVSHIQRLAGFHLGLNVVRTFKIVTDISRRQGTPRSCGPCGSGGTGKGDGSTGGRPCPYDLNLRVDCGEDQKSVMAAFAQQSWDAVEEDLSQYIRAHIALRKLSEVAERVGARGEAIPTDSLEEIAGVEAKADQARLDGAFDARLDELLAADSDGEAQLASLTSQLRSLDVSPFQTYVAVLGNLSQQRWGRYHRYLIDSLFLKNTAEGFLLQPLGGKRRRRFALSAGLLETLTLIALVQETDRGLETRQIRVDRMIERLETRYSLVIATPPPGGSLDEAAAILGNEERFRSRLRETGLFVDLSDAFLAQTITPRIQVRA